MKGPTAAEIVALRTASGFGLVDCRLALLACAGQADLAVVWLEKRHLAVSCVPGHHPRDRVAAEANARVGARQDFLRLLWARVDSDQCPPAADLFIRTSGDMRCPTCGRDYWHHPRDTELEWLRVRCDGQRLKL